MKMQDQESTAVSLLNKRPDEVNESISNILSAIEQGIFTPSTKQRLEELEGQKKEFEIELQRKVLQDLCLTVTKLNFGFIVSERWMRLNRKIAEGLLTVS